MKVGTRVKCKCETVGRYYDEIGTITSECNDTVKVFFDSQMSDKLTQHDKLRLSFWFYKHELEVMKGGDDE